MRMLLLLLAACGEVDVENAAQEAVADEAPASPSAAAPGVEAAAPAAAATVTVTVSGELRCADHAGPFVVEGYRVPSGLQRGTDEPAAPVEVSRVEITEGVAFSIEMPPGPRRRVLARLGERAAYPARGAQPWDITTPIVGLVLDCGVGVEGLPEVRPNRHVRPQASGESWVTERGGGSGGLHKMDGYNADLAEGALRARYKDRLSEQELAVLMPLLVQSGQDPRATDALVDSVVGGRQAAGAGPKIGSRGRK